MLVLSLAAASLAAAFAVWTAVPVVTTAGEYSTYVRLAAAIIAGTVAAFVGAFVLQAAVDVAMQLVEE